MAEVITVLEVIGRTTAFLAARGVEPARLNAELLVGHVLGLPRMRLYMAFERPLAQAELDALRGLVRRRGRREPLQHVVGEVDFGGLRLLSDRRALVPRPETEWVVDTVAGRIAAGEPPARILDLGTGSGAIALALARAFPGALVTAVDRSPEALALAAENAGRTGLAARVVFLMSDWFSGVPAGEPFDLVVSNPPYLSEAELAAAEPEVRDHDPRAALVAPEDGLADLRVILAGALGRLRPGGLVALETGTAHHAALAAAAPAAGYARWEGLRDLAGRDRLFLAWAP